MDLLEESDASDCSSVDESDPHVLPSRQTARIGQAVTLPNFSGRPIGDDVSWKGSSAVRVVAIQCGSSGMDRYQWGLRFGESLAHLGADIGILSETGLRSEAHHTFAVKGLLSRGYQAISHGRPPGDPCADGSGVLLAVRSGYLDTGPTSQKTTPGAPSLPLYLPLPAFHCVWWPSTRPSAPASRGLPAHFFNRLSLRFMTSLTRKLPPPRAPSQPCF